MLMLLYPRAGLYPASADEYEGLAAAIERLNLNDASVTVRKETSDALGAGFRYVGR
jgi:GTP-binding protein LepA